MAETTKGTRDYKRINGVTKGLQRIANGMKGISKGMQENKRNERDCKGK